MCKYFGGRRRVQIFQYIRSGLRCLHEARKSFRRVKIDEGRWLENFEADGGFILEEWSSLSSPRSNWFFLSLLSPSFLRSFSRRMKRLLFPGKLWIWEIYLYKLLSLSPLPQPTYQSLMLIDLGRDCSESIYLYEAYSIYICIDHYDISRNLGTQLSSKDIASDRSSK